MGGTHVQAGIVKNGVATNILSQRINAGGSVEEVLNELFKLTDKAITSEVKGIGIGFSGLSNNGIAYDMYNIPSWKKVPLQQRME